MRHPVEVELMTFMAERQQPMEATTTRSMEQRTDMVMSTVSRMLTKLEVVALRVVELNKIGTHTTVYPTLSKKQSTRHAIAPCSSNKDLVTETSRKSVREVPAVTIRVLVVEKPTNLMATKANLLKGPQIKSKEK